MARPKSEEKRLNLLHAATAAVADRGIAASTLAIAKLAGVAEGTLFRYFATKEILLNELYIYIYSDLTTTTRASLDLTQPLRARAHAAWNSYIDWALAKPEWNRAKNQLAVTDLLTADTRLQEEQLFPDRGLLELFTNNAVFQGLSRGFADAVFVAVADATIEFAKREPQIADDYRLRGFNAFWRIFDE